MVADARERQACQLFDGFRDRRLQVLKKSRELFLAKVSFEDRELEQGPEAMNAGGVLSSVIAPEVTDDPHGDERPARRGEIGVGRSGNPPVHVELFDTKRAPLTLDDHTQTARVLETLRARRDFMHRAVRGEPPRMQNHKIAPVLRLLEGARERLGGRVRERTFNADGMTPELHNRDPSIFVSAKCYGKTSRL